LSSLRDDFAAFQGAGAAVLGINPASVEAHQRYAQKLGLPFPLLSDANREAARAYHALQENGTSILRTVVVVDKQGKIAHFQRGHQKNQEILDLVRRGG